MKKKIKTEQNIIIIMDAIKKIMTIFLGPFLTAYFISTSTNSILNIAIYYIFTYATMALSTLVVAALAEKRNRIKIFRIGIILNFIYILIIILLKPADISPNSSNVFNEICFVRSTSPDPSSFIFPLRNSV